MLVKVNASAVYGISALPISVEVSMKNGSKFYMVGLPDNAVKESQWRVFAAIKNTDIFLPTKHTTINLAPADLKKEGASYDLPIALGLLCGTAVIPANLLEEYVIMGELSLDGEVKPIKGALPIAIRAREDGFKGVILPYENALEASVVEEIDVIGVKHLKEVIAFACGDDVEPIRPEPFMNRVIKNSSSTIDFSDVRGQESAKRAMEIAAAGGHNIVLVGPPGVGKTMLAKRLPTILPPLTMEEALETTKIHSVAGLLNASKSLIVDRPFRSPHHTVSDVALVGGGTNPKPGEISLAHNGVLFLDELPEFKRAVLEVMRQPLEDRVVTISRARITVDYPSSFMLVASMNPSPSGDFYDPRSSTGDSEQAVRRYLGRVSGPLLDRIDLHIELSKIPFDELASKRKGEPSKAIRTRVIKARAIQTQRYMDFASIHCNAQLTPKLIERYCVADKKGEMILKRTMERLGLSARSYSRILKVARTIADLEDSNSIEAKHIAEAVQFRALDRMMDFA